jgi:hypothetical protein
MRIRQRFHGIPSKYLSLFLLFIAICNQSFGQDFGGFKPGMNWQQINTPIVRVIFPEGLESAANRVANNLSHVTQNNQSSIGPLNKKIDLILNNQGIISNGYVTVMPFRSEFYTTPMQDGFSLGTLPWLDLLSLHEYRHALQYVNMRRGFTKAAWFLFGDAGWGTMLNITTPGWFFEGDAVAVETALSKQGRGRMPSFMQQSRSLALYNKRYSYMKARNGSYRDIVPDEYELGYLLCSYGREKFGNNLWSDVLRRTSTLKGIVYPFSDALQAKTGMYTPEFYRAALADYQKIWTGEIHQIPITPTRAISLPTKTVTEYRFPVWLDSGGLLVYKKSFKEIGAIYRIDTSGNESKISNLGINLDPYFTAAKNLLAWTEVTWDARYSSLSYSDVVLFQTDSEKKQYLTHKQRYFSPALSPDGSLIAVVEVSLTGQSEIKILDSKTGEVAATLPNDEKLFYTYPKWDLDGRSIISAARTSDGSMLIIQQRIEDGFLTKLSGTFNQILGEVVVQSDALLFTSGFSGINNIYSLSRINGTISQLTGSRFGAYYPTVDPIQNRLIYSDFDIRGYHLVSASMDSLLWLKTDPTILLQNFEFEYFKTEGGDILSKIPDEKFRTSPYRPLQHPIRLHSWAFNADFYSAGINISSDNTLSNIHLEGGFNYYYQEKAPGFSVLAKYGGFFPIISAGASRYYRHPSFLDVFEGTESSEATSIDNSLSFDVEIPLDLTKGEFVRQANFKIGYDYTSVEHLSAMEGGEDRFSKVSAASGDIQFSSRRKRAYQNITTSLGASLKLSANKSIAFTEAARYLAIGDFAIRGIWSNHNLVLSTGVKFESDRNPYQFMDQFIYPRGYNRPRNDRMFTVQSSYHFPIAYPDFGFWGIFYCSRVRATVFADYGHASIPEGIYDNTDGNFLSAGGELTFDTRWFNLADIPMGIRVSKLFTADRQEPDKRRMIEFVIPVIRL